MKPYLRLILSILIVVAGVHQFININVKLEEVMPILIILGAYFVFIAFTKILTKTKIQTSYLLN